jgi:hypothetical protein
MERLTSARQQRGSAQGHFSPFAGPSPLQRRIWLRAGPPALRMVGGKDQRNRSE